MQTTGTEAIQIVVNGEDRRIPQGLTLVSLLDLLELDPERVAVEMNGSIVRRPAWSATLVSARATFEIVQFVGGG
jgi:thiamine biosynthesis protein ThiS